MVRRLVCLALLGALLPAAASAHVSDPDHADPRGALPDTLVTQPVAQAEMSSIQPDTALSATPGSLPETWCGTETTVNRTAGETTPVTSPHYKLIYAYASGQPNDFATWRNPLQANVSLLGRYFASQSQGRKAIRWDMGTDCGTSPHSYVDIQVVALPKTLAEYNANLDTRFNLLDADVRAAIGAGPRGSASGPRNLMIYADGFFVAQAGGGGIGGEGSVYRNPACCGTPTPDDSSFTLHDAGGLTATVYGPQDVPSNGYAWPSPMLHEITHNLGAVQNSAPNTSAAGHCDDRYDVMCYPDGGSSYSETTPCPKVNGVVMDETYDCGGNDYFNVNPATGSYLDTGWNTYASAFLGTCSTELADSCGLAAAAGDGTKPVNTTPTPSASYYETYATTLSGTDASAVDAFQWRLDNGAIQRTPAVSFTAADGNHTLASRVRDSAGNWSAWRKDTVRIDKSGPIASITCSETWSQSPPPCSVSISDASGVATIETRRGGGAITQTSGGGYTTTTATRAPTADAQLIEVRGIDTAGRTGEWAQALARRDTTAPAATVSCPATWGDGKTTCHVDASDAASGVASMTWRIGTGTPTTIPAGGDFDVAVEGQQTISVLVTDGVGLTRTATATSKVDSTPPQVSLSCPSQWSLSGSCSVTATDPESGVTGRFGALNGGPETSAVSGITTTTSGTHSVVGRAVNGAGASASTAPAELKIDRTKPLVGITCPLGWQRSPFSCSVTGADAHSGVKSVQWRIDGGAITTVGSNMTTVPISAQGAHTVEVQTIDQLDQASGWQSAEAKVDGTDPTATLSCPTAWQADAATCTTTTGDTGGSGVESATWRLDGDPVDRALPISVTEHGEHTVTLRVRDHAANVNNAYATVKVDDTAPTASVDCPAGWQVAAFDCTAALDDPESGVTARTVSVDGAPPSALSGTTIPIATGGEHSVVVAATNGAGRTTTSSPATARLDRTAPVAGVTCTDGWQAASITCTANGSDGQSGLDSLVWRLDGGTPTPVADGATFQVATHGAHTVEVVATDEAGLTDEATDTASIDATAPVVSVSCAEGWRASAGSCTYTATDPESGVTVRTARIDGGEPFVVSGGAIPVSGEGAHAVEVRAVNAVARESAWSAASTLRIDLTSPVADVACQDGWRQDAVTCSVTGTDAGGSGIDTLTWKVGSGAAQTVASGATVTVEDAGERTVTAVATDRAGRTATATDVAQVDDAAPTASVSCPSGWQQDASACTATVGDAGESGVAERYSRIGTGAGSAFTGTSVPVAAEGEHAVSVRAVDGAGRDSGWSAAATLKIDKGDPSAGIACADGFDADAVACTITGADALSGLASLTYSVGGGPAVSVESGDVVAITADGVNTVTVTATDRAGHTTTASDTASVDRTAPAATLACDDGWRTEKVTCAVTAADTGGSGVATLTRKVGDGAPVAIADGGSFEVDGHGEHAVALVATDAAGNERTITDTARIDKTAPTGVAISCPQAWQAATATCTVAAADPESGIASRAAQVDGANATVSGSTVTVPAAGGERSVTASATNGAGLTSAAATAATVRFDLLAPTVSLACTSLGGGKHRCTPQASDAHSGVASLRLVRDGSVDATPRSSGTAFEVSGPASVAVTATDGVGRAATSAAQALAGPPAAQPEPPKQDPPPAAVAPPVPAPGTAITVTPPPAPLAVARGTARVGTGTGTVEVTGGRAAIALQPGRLKPGVYRLEICLGKKCTRRTVTVRKTGKPAPLRITTAATGEVRATFAVLKKAKGRFKRQSRGATSAKSG